MYCAFMACVVLAAIVAEPGAAAAQRVTEHDGASALGLALRRLGVTQRVLLIGAHPDDENTTLIAKLALGSGAEVGYLSLTRGEGGQNLIGPELEEALGLTRTEELLSARRLDGAQQFFTRAYDFGYSRSAAETFRKWPREEILADVVEVVRKFQPDVIAPVFSGTPQDGHGHHQASALLAQEAFEAAADPKRFPEQLARGLQPHKTAYLYHVLFRRADRASFELATGDLDPLLGRSYYQIAMASRSRHRSQDMGSAESIGPQTTWLIPLAGPVPPGAESLFTGLDTTLVQRAARPGTSALTAELRAYESQVADVRARFNPLRTAELVAPLAGAVGRLIRVDSLLGNRAADAAFRRHLHSEMADAADALRRAAGVLVDATSDAAFVAPDQTVVVTLSVWNGGSGSVTVDRLEPRLPAGWTSEPLEDAGNTVPSGQVVSRRFRIRVPRTAAVSNPYYLRAPRNGEMYVWPQDAAAHARPFEASALQASARLRVAGTPVEVESEITFLHVDKSLGELRRPVLIVPRVNISVEPRVQAVPLASSGARAFQVSVAISSDVTEGLQGKLSLDLPAGWRSEPASTDVSVGNGETVQQQFRISPAAQQTPGTARITARFQAEDGESYSQGYRTIAHDHTQPRLLFEPATVSVSAFDVTLDPGLVVGYVPGAGDDAARALSQMGARVETLNAEALARSDLSRFAAIITGMRAYEVNRDLIAHNARLLDYAKNGGTVIVQYNKYELVEGAFAPYPLTMARPHGRVADESAPVRILDPGHRLFSTPNRITERDFQGWVQERGLYFADTWDAQYRPLLEMHDEGEPPLQGSLLMADVGRGVYVYCALSLFRQWPKGVPGAYRLLANLVSLRR